MRLDLYILEECAKARKKAREEGIDEGIGLGMDAAARLAKALTDAGRAEEIAGALADEEWYDALMHEFGLATDDIHNS